MQLSGQGSLKQTVTDYRAYIVPVAICLLMTLLILLR